MDSEEFGYRRERQHHDAAKAAASTTARRAHQELAESYAVLLMRLQGQDPVTQYRQVGLL